MKFAHTPLLLLASFACLVPGCMEGSKYGPLGAACPHLHSRSDLATAQISANAHANAKVRAFLMAARDLIELSAQMEAQAAGACRQIGLDIGLTQPDMAPRSDEPGETARAACNALAARLDAIFQQGIQVRVQATPPSCQADLQAKARCDAACDVQVDPGQIVAQCEPARLSGYCQGRCVGRCDGTCQGQCQGQCSAFDAQGQCIGQCNGTCNGGCNATCHAHCEGQWQAPQCEGYVRPPSADAECNASCGAHANFRAQCTPAQVNVQVSENAELAARLAASMQANLPTLLHAEIALGRRLIQDARVVVEVGAGLPRVIGNAGAEAMACVAATASGTVKASARINVSVQASASVTGRVGAT